MTQGQTQTVAQPFTYVGQYGVMAEPYGYYSMRARYYDSGSGRFVSEDPLGFGGGDVNLSSYVGGDPINGIDPNGLAKYGITRPESHPGGQEHIHWGTDKNPRSNGAINKDGTIRHGPEDVPRKVIDLINQYLFVEFKRNTFFDV